MNNITRKKNPITWVPSVYFAMGLPFVILNMVVVLMYKDFGVSDSEIAFWTSLIMIPWTLKPLWSPFLEMYKTKKYFVVLTQILSGLLFGLIAFTIHLPAFFAISIGLLACIAFSGATHDIATDGVYMTELDKENQAKYIGWQGAFYNLAKVMATGVLVYFSGILTTEFGAMTAWTIVMCICGAMLLLLGLYHMRALPSGEKAKKEEKPLKERMEELWSVFKDFFTKKHIIYYMFFIILYRFAEGFVMKIVPLFLKAPIAEQGLGLSKEQIGLYYGTFGAAAFILGSILGGYYIARFGLKKTLFTLCCVFNFPFVVYTLFAIYQPSSSWLIATGISFEYLGYGFGFVGLTLFMMQQIAPGKHQMAHYAFATGIMNLGVMLPGMFSGMISDEIGYEKFFIFVLFATIPALLITWFVPFTYTDEKKKVTK